MDAKHRVVQLLGWLSVIAGYGFALLLIRGIFVGLTRGFAGGHNRSFWILLGYLLFLAFAIYLFNLGRRALSFAKGSPRPKPRFGWGRMLLGTIFLFSSAVDHFHLLPAGRTLKRLEPSNQTQAVAMNVTTIALCVGCVLLILSGIWRGFRRSSTESIPNF